MATYRGILEPAYEIGDLLNMAAGHHPNKYAGAAAKEKIKAQIDWDGGAYGEPVYVRFPAALKTVFEGTEMLRDIIALDEAGK